jgi:predicted glycosyltransferase
MQNDSIRDSIFKLPKILFITNNISQARIFDAIRKELPESRSLAITTDWHNNEAGKVLDDAGFPNRSIQTYSQSNPRRILDIEKPDLVVVGHDLFPVNTSFIDAANTMAIQTLLVQDGILAAQRQGGTAREVYSRLRFLFTFPWRLSDYLGHLKNKGFTAGQILPVLFLELKYNAKGKVIGRYGRGSCSKIAVFGDAVKEMLLSEGVNPGRIVVTGSPKFDRISQYQQIDCREVVRSRLSIPEGNRMVLLVTQFFSGVGAWVKMETLLSSIIEGVRHMPRVSLVIKLHPGENEHNYKKIVNKLNYPAIILGNADITELLKASDVVITISSTAALEAMSLKKPVVIVDLFRDPSVLFYLRSGAWYVCDRKDIKPTIERVLSRQDSFGSFSSGAMFVQEQAFRQDGSAAKRISDLIVAMIGNRVKTG